MLSIGDIADIPAPKVGPKYQIGATIHATFNHGICQAEIIAVTNRAGEYTYDIILLTGCDSRSGLIPAGTKTWVYLEQIIRLS